MEQIQNNIASDQKNTVAIEIPGHLAVHDHLQKRSCDL